ncbi:Short-chain dehydrogenase reductase SDR [Fusarium albosuccineum]|uniref:Short-chain dehydrogenase reductase SDR n=1 Tax=Fusarium albosuccineum TaxID=1237068 RepID=A0A8H4LEC5_9HYPO|nr:Short-chain dehydrogenase reductase SDR [Fusarium albosuccineum]
MSTMPFFQPSIRPLPADLDFQGQTIIVTGASSGLGLEFREQTKATLLADPSIRKSDTRADIRVMKFDADSFESTKAFAAQVKQEFKQVHVLMLNAGANGITFEQTKDGHEKTVQVNLLANTLLFFELLPLLEETAEQTGKPTRMSMTGSRMYDTGSLCKMPSSKIPEQVIKYLDDPTTFQGFFRYGDSKILVLLFIHQLGKLYGSHKVIVNNFCPGMVDTPMTKNLPWYLRVPVAALGQLRRIGKVEHGGWIGLNAAAVAGPESHGQLIGDTEVEEIDAFYGSDAMRLLAQRLWQETVEEVAGFGAVPEWANADN